MGDSGNAADHCPELHVNKIFKVHKFSIHLYITLGITWVRSLCLWLDFHTYDLWPCLWSSHIHVSTAISYKPVMLRGLSSPYSVIDLYSGDIQFESWLGHWAIWRVFMAFLKFSKQTPGQYLGWAAASFHIFSNSSLTNNPNISTVPSQHSVTFLPNLFQFIISTLYSPNTVPQKT